MSVTSVGDSPKHLQTPKRQISGAGSLNSSFVAEVPSPKKAPERRCHYPLTRVFLDLEAKERSPALQKREAEATLCDHPERATSHRLLEEYWVHARENETKVKVQARPFLTYNNDEPVP